ncbi:hypothetical protein ABVN80_04500 [Acinetobacter baumannii]
MIPTDEEGRIAKETRQVVEVSQNTSPEVSCLITEVKKRYSFIYRFI